jgi:hypothetical protein
MAQRDQRSPGAIPAGLGPRRWSAEPQVVKAGFRERKGLSSAQTHNKSEVELSAPGRSPLRAALRSR